MAVGNLPPMKSPPSRAETNDASISATKIHPSPTNLAPLENLSPFSNSISQKPVNMEFQLPQRSFSQVVQEFNRPTHLMVPQSDLDFNAFLKPITFVQGKPTVLFPLSEKKVLVDKLKLVLVGKFSHGMPNLNHIRNFFSAMKLQRSCSVSFFDRKHIFIECFCKNDFDFIWLHLAWVIEGFTMRVFKWSDDFNPTKESAIVPVWVRLEGLPLYMFDEMSLLAIGNSVGKPIKVDPRNVNRSIVHSARICVELDVSRPLLDSISVNFEDEVTKVVFEGFRVKILYDELPPYCDFCCHLGHGVGSCKRREENALHIELSPTARLPVWSSSEGQETYAQIPLQVQGTRANGDAWATGVGEPVLFSGVEIAAGTAGTAGAAGVTGRVGAAGVTGRVGAAVTARAASVAAADVAARSASAAVAARAAGVAGEAARKNDAGYTYEKSAAGVLFPRGAAATFAPVHKKQDDSKGLPGVGTEPTGESMGSTELSMQSSVSVQNLGQIAKFETVEQVKKVEKVEHVEQQEQVVQPKISNKKDTVTACKSVGNYSRITEQKWKARRPYVVEKPDHGSNKDTGTGNSRVAISNIPDFTQKAQAQAKSLHNVDTPRAAEVEGHQELEQDKECDEVVSVPLETSKSEQEEEVCIRSWADSVEEEEKEEHLRITSQLSLSEVEDFSKKEIEKIWATPTKVTRVFDTSRPIISNPYIRDKKGNPVLCSEILGKSNRLSGLRMVAASLRTEENLAILVERGTYDGLMKELIEMYSKGIRQDIEDHVQAG